MTEICSTCSVCTTDSDICIQSEHCFDLYKAECHLRLNVGSLKHAILLRVGVGSMPDGFQTKLIAAFISV